MNRKNISNKLLTIIFFAFLLHILLNILYIKNTNFKKYIEDNYPKIKKTIFATPAILDLEKETSKADIPYKLSFLEKEINNSQFLNFSTKKIPLDLYNYSISNMKAVAFIDFYQKNLFIVSGDGRIYYMQNKDLLNIKSDKANLSKIINIKSNIKEIIQDKSFFDFQNKIEFSKFNSVSDILIFKDYIYLSYNRILKDNCYTKSIIRSKINYNYLEFEDFFFDDQECIKTSKKRASFNGHQSGGRMISIDKNSSFNKFNKTTDKILFTIGDYRSDKNKSVPIAQNDKSIFGKTLLIDIKSKKFKIFTKGHRNPQGLLYDNENEIILSTEHGPYGGDEINKLSYGKNYGWPISSYGENYRSVPGDKNKKFFFKKKHDEHGYEEPIIALTKSIGISEIIKVPNNFNSKWRESYLATSLNGHVILRFNLDKKFNKIQSLEILRVGERIRDIKINNNKIYMILENTPYLGIYKID